MLRSDALQLVGVALGFGVFVLVWAGLGLSIAKIARRQQNPPSFNVVLNAAHLGRFAGWALVGAATLREDFWTGAWLIATRLPAAGLVAVTFLQRRQLRPSRALLVRTLVPLIGGLGLLCVGMAVASDAPKISIQLFGWQLPRSTPVGYASNALVLACFAVQVLYALPQQIREARTKPLGNLRWFQLALLANYGFTLAYSWLVRDDLVRAVMMSAYAAVLVEQAILVSQIERAVRRRR